ncbi:DHA2 family efflux MFS transporter permease subunit [Desertibaculum subflavum]|uniref:DHA2 family efflux MFS transporter permease subunit n=1 Tax=Desertibaculum subflavum TaxID=2268458 RepID=UPI0034D23F5C
MTAPHPSTLPPAPQSGRYGVLTPAFGGGRMLAGYIAMVFGLFMAILDIQIVSSSLAEIQAGLSATPDEISWVQSSYLIAEVIMIPLSGYLSRLLSTRILFVLSAASFTIASVACAFATSLEAMIVARAAQGFLGGAMIPTVFAASFMLYPGERRVRASVIVGLVATLAPTIGPTLGGWITDWLSWHWLFLINVVPGICICIAVWLFADLDRPDWSLLRNIDFAGLVGMALFLGSLEYVLEEGPRNDWLEDPSIFDFTVVAVVGGLIFFWRTFTAKNPIVDLRPFTDRNFATGTIFGFTLGVALYGLVYVLPLYLAQVRHLTAAQIGEILFVTGACQFIVAPLAGRLTQAIDARLILTLGFALLGISTWQMTHVTNEWEFHELLWPQVWRGIGLMLCIVPINFLALGTLPPPLLKSAAGLYNLTRNLGGAFGIAIINSLLIDARAEHWTTLSAKVTPGAPEVQAFLDRVTARMGDMIPGDAELAAMKRLVGLAQQQVLVMSFADTFAALTAAFFGVAAAVWLMRKPAPAPGGA